MKLGKMFVSILTLGLVLLGLPGSSPAQGPPREDLSFRASQLSGYAVVDQEGQGVGRIVDLLLDPDFPARILFAVVEPSGSLGLGPRRLLPIPMTAFRWDTKRAAYTLDLARDQLRDAPTFDQARWPNLKDREWSVAVYRYFNQPLHWVG